MSNSRRTIINLVCSLMVLVTNLLVYFFLSPFIVEHIGVEANGFVTLASNFITYAQLATAALNSMAARYISIAYVRKEFEKANLYYNSVFWGNLVIVAVLILPAVYFIACMERLVNVPTDIVFDVKLLFSFVFFNFLLTTGLPNWECGTFVTNRLDRSYIPNMAMSLLKCIVLFAMLTFLAPRVWYIGMTSSVTSLIWIFIQGYNTHVLTPELRVYINKEKRMCSWSAIKELVGSGIWNSISNMGIMLLNGLDLIICNLFIGTTTMGVVALSTTFPTLLQQLSESIRGSFAPELTINYAKGDKHTVLSDLKRAMKLTSFIMTIPIGGIIVLGDRFFELWIPSQDARLLQVLSILSIFGFAFTSGTQILYNVFQVANKVKSNAIALLLSGFGSIVVTLLLMRFTDWDIYLVVGVSTIASLIRNMCFTLPMTAKYLGFKKSQFFPQVGSSLIATSIIVLVGLLVRLVIPSGGWMLFLLSAFVVALLGGIINFYVILKKEDRRVLTSKITNKLRLK